MTEAFHGLHRHEVLERPSDSSTSLYSFLFCDHSTVCNLYSTLEGHAHGSIAAGDHIVATPPRAALPRESPYLLKCYRDSMAYLHATLRHNGFNFDANKMSSSQAITNQHFHPRQQYVNHAAPFEPPPSCANADSNWPISFHPSLSPCAPS